MTTAYVNYACENSNILTNFNHSLQRSCLYNACVRAVAAKQPIGPSGRKIEWGPSPPLPSPPLPSPPLSFLAFLLPSIPTFHLFFTPSKSPIALLPNSPSLSLTPPFPLPSSPPFCLLLPFPFLFLCSFPGGPIGEAPGNFFHASDAPRRVLAHCWYENPYPDALGFSLKLQQI
jgi:hypothetical protein